jgi:hypothetical protein
MRFRWMVSPSIQRARRTAAETTTGYGCEIDPAFFGVALERLAMLGLEPELVHES